MNTLQEEPGPFQKASWDLVTMSSQIPLRLPTLPNLLTQPFNQIPHRNLTNLNLHAWVLEPQQSRNRASLRQWQQQLRLLKEDQPDQSMKQSGPFLQSGASLIGWTSGPCPSDHVQSDPTKTAYLTQSINTAL